MTVTTIRTGGVARTLADYLLATTGNCTINHGDHLVLAGQRFTVNNEFLMSLVCDHCRSNVFPASILDVELHLAEHPAHLRKLLVNLVELPDDQWSSLATFLTDELLRFIAIDWIGLVDVKLITDLREAVAEQHAFAQDPSGWCDQHEMQSDHAADYLERIVDDALDALVATR